MKKLKQQFKFLRAFLKLVKDPNRTENIFKMSEVAIKNPDKASAQFFVETALKNDSFKKLFSESYLPAAVSKEFLKSCPAGSLGKAVGDFLEANQLSLDFYPKICPATPLEYLTLRMRQTHDIFHVVTGYGTSLEDEIAMQAFLVAQTSSAFSGLLIVAALLHTLKSNPRNLKNLFAATVTGYRLGERSHFLLGIDWENRWTENLELLQIHCGLSPKRNNAKNQETTSPSVALA